MSEPQVGPREATYADLEAVPDHLVAEILDGELFTSPRPRSRHARTSFRMTIDLGTAFDGPGRGGAPGGWWLLDEPELHFGRDVLVPDLAAWRQERMPVIPDVLFFELAPDWVCEVVSPSTEAIDRGRKRHIYARAGVRHLWMVNPASRTLEVFRSEGGLWLEIATHLGGVRVRAEPFDAIELDMAPWFLPD